MISCRCTQSCSSWGNTADGPHHSVWSSVWNYSTSGSHNTDRHTYLPVRQKTYRETDEENNDACYLTYSAAPNFLHKPIGQFYKTYIFSLLIINSHISCFINVKRCLPCRWRYAERWRPVSAPSLIGGSEENRDALGKPSSSAGYGPNRHTAASVGNRFCLELHQDKIFFLCT